MCAYCVELNLNPKPNPFINCAQGAPLVCAHGGDAAVGHPVSTRVAGGRSVEAAP